MDNCFPHFCIFPRYFHHVVSLFYSVFLFFSSPLLSSSLPCPAVPGSRMHTRTTDSTQQDTTTHITSQDIWHLFGARFGGYGVHCTSLTLDIQIHKVSLDEEDAATVEGSLQLTTSDNKPPLMSASRQQAVPIAIESDHSSFHLYKTFVLTATCGTKFDQSILAVGYGTESATSGFNVETDEYKNPCFTA